MTKEKNTTTEKNEEKKGSRNKLTAFMIAPQFNNEHWAYATHEPTPPNCCRDSGYDSDAAAWGVYDTRKDAHDKILTALEAARAGNVRPLLEWIAERLSLFGVKAIYGILHNQDDEEKFDIESGTKKTVRVEDHCQTLVIFEAKKSAAARTIKNIAEALGLAENAIEKPEKGRYSLDNQLAYLTHIKYTDKHQYSPKDVVSIIPEGSTGEEYTVIYERRYFDWVRGRGSVAGKKAKINIDFLIEEILAGHITKRQILMQDDLYSTYARNRKRVDDALLTYAERREETNAHGLENGEFQKRIVFIYGTPRSGKTHLAKEFAQMLVMKSMEAGGEAWRIKRLASKNPFDKYRGEEIIIADDLRCESLPREEWLHFLNVDDAEEQAARFKNVQVAPRAVIIVAPFDPVLFFGQLRDEDINQYIGRIEVAVSVAIPNLHNQKKTTFKVGRRKVVEPYQREEHILNFDFDFGAETYYCNEAAEKAIELLAAPISQDEESNNPILSDPFFDESAEEDFWNNLEKNYDIFVEYSYEIDSENEDEKESENGSPMEQIELFSDAELPEKSRFRLGD